MKKSFSDYSVIAEDYHRVLGDLSVRKAEHEWLQKQIERMTLSLGRKPLVWELGCGSGAFPAAFQDRIGGYRGFEPTPALAALARERLPPGFQVTEDLVSLERLVASEPPDVLVCLFSLRHVFGSPSESLLRMLGAKAVPLLAVEAVRTGWSLSWLTDLFRGKVPSAKLRRRMNRQGLNRDVDTQNFMEKKLQGCGYSPSSEKISAAWGRETRGWLVF